MLLLNDISFAGIDLIDTEDFFNLLLRFLFNFVITTFIIRFLYYPNSRRKDYLFTYIMISTAIFLLIILLETIKMNIGFALGLFAIFGIIRYRTNTVPIKEMTYLFVVIAISVINGMTSKKISYAEIMLTNMLFIFVLLFLEKIWLAKKESKKVINYEKIDLIKPEKRAELIADLEERTGIKINRLEIGKIDFLKDTARIRIYYYEESNMLNYQGELDTQLPDVDDD